MSDEKETGTEVIRLNALIIDDWEFEIDVKGPLKKGLKENEKIIEIRPELIFHVTVVSEYGSGIYSHPHNKKIYLNMKWKKPNDSIKP